MLVFSSGKLEEVTPTFWAVFAHANGMLEVRLIFFHHYHVTQ